MQVARVFKKALIGKVHLPISQQCVYMITSWNEAWGTGSIKTSSAWKRLVRVLNKCNLPHSVINLRKLLLILSITNAGLVKVHEVDRDSSEALQTITECRTIITAAIWWPGECLMPSKVIKHWVTADTCFVN